MHDVTIVVNGHREASLIIPTLRCVALAAAYARANGISCGVCVLLDRPDEATIEAVEDVRQDDWQVLHAAVGDLGLARNEAVDRAAPSRYVAFMDGDDLCSRNWVSEAFRVSERARQPTVWHPAANYIFGPDPTYVFWHRGMSDPMFSLSYLVLENYYTALSYADRSIYESIPYTRNRLSEGWGYEDWSWNAETIAAGITHEVVPGTAHFVRRKPKSLLKDTKSASALPQLAPLRELLMVEGDQRSAKRHRPDPAATAAELLARTKPAAR